MCSKRCLPGVIPADAVPYQPPSWCVYQTKRVEAIINRAAGWISDQACRPTRSQDSPWARALETFERRYENNFRVDGQQRQKSEKNGRHGRIQD